MSMRGGFPRAYTPVKTRSAECDVISYLTAAWRYSPVDGPVTLQITFYVPLPKSTSKRKANDLIASGVVKRPDLDNYVKLVCDAANGVLWNDDSQIWSLQAKKVYSSTGRIELDMFW